MYADDAATMTKNVDPKKKEKEHMLAGESVAASSSTASQPPFPSQVHSTLIRK